MKEQSMKIVQINATYGLGSTGMIVKDIHELLLKQNVVSYVACALSSITGENIIKMESTAGRKWHALMTRVMGRQGYNSKRATKKLILQLREIKPDIVHLHNLHSNYINLKLLFDYLLREEINTVLTLHDCWFFTGKCFHYLAEGCMKWKKECGACPRKKKDIPSLFFDRSREVYLDKKRMYSNMKSLYTVAVSKWLESQARQSILRNSGIYQIYNGVDINTFSDKGQGWRRRHHLRAEEFVVLGMANKWLDAANRSVLEQIVEKLNDSISLVLVGCTDDTVIDSKYVVKMGYITDRAELAEIYSSADVFVNLTWEDSLPTVNIEALACGTPVISYDSGGSPEIMDEKTGIVVPQGAGEAVWSAICKVKSEGRQTYSAACRERAETYYDKNKQYELYLNLYQSICARSEGNVTNEMD